MVTRRVAANLLPLIPPAARVHKRRAGTADGYPQPRQSSLIMSEFVRMLSHSPEAPVNPWNTDDIADACTKPRCCLAAG